MNTKMKGIICGIISAITYGLNPLGALKLYSNGLNVDSVMFYRYGLAMILLAGIMLFQKMSFNIGRQKLLICALLGIIFAIASISLFSSFYYMDAGVACTLLFIYPVLVAIIMSLFFKEQITIITIFSIVMVLMGIGLLYYGGEGMVLSIVGVLLVMLSAFAYAVYIVIVSKSGVNLPPITLTFFVMLFGTLTIILHSFIRDEYHIQMLTNLWQLQWVIMLAVVPTIISLVLMVVAIKNIGSIPTSIMGALDPVTAVVIGVTIFNESFTLRIAMGMVLILVAVLLIIIEKPLISRLKNRHLLNLKADI